MSSTGEERGKSGGVRGGRGREGEAVSFPHVLLSHRTELLLASRVQHWGREREEWGSEGREGKGNSGGREGGEQSGKGGRVTVGEGMGMVGEVRGGSNLCVLVQNHVQTTDYQFDVDQHFSSTGKVNLPSKTHHWPSISVCCM